MPIEPDTLLTVREVAEILKVPTTWVYDHARPDCANPLPFLKVGKYLRFIAADILTYVRNSRDNVTPERRKAVVSRG
ncbi:MAG: helix-turn-helix domain-containing protein [Candidatus Sulfotelmatobacter sp.]